MNNRYRKTEKKVGGEKKRERKRKTEQQGNTGGKDGDKTEKGKRRLKGSKNKIVVRKIPPNTPPPSWHDLDGMEVTRLDRKLT